MTLDLPDPDGPTAASIRPAAPDRSSTCTKRVISRSRPWKSAASDSLNARSALNGLTRSETSVGHAEPPTSDCVAAGAGTAARSSSMVVKRSPGFFAVARATMSSTQAGTLGWTD